MTTQNSNKNKDWTEPTYLSKQDHNVLKEVKRLYEAGKFKEALNRACNCDTAVREEVPLEIWKEIGGRFTKSGEEELKEIRKQKKNKEQKISKNHKNL